MSWLYLAVMSGVILGIYDLFKKQSVKDNAVLPVLLFSNIASALVWIPLLLLSMANPSLLPSSALVVEPMSLLEHGYVAIKSCIVGISWLLGYFAIKHLPISIAGTIRSTGPVYTLTGALLIYQEGPNTQQWTGMVITLLFFIALSIVGRKEGIKFENNRWIWMVILATLVGACSGLWDKFLLGKYGLKPSSVQAWFSIYLVVFMLIPFWGWLKGWWTRSHFQWKWTIPLIGISLLLADFCYFTALSNPDAMVSVISCLRRTGVLVTFFLGTLLFNEKQFWRKLPCVLGILGGILIIVLA